jgi:putative ABC transport system ATP-binding protein
LNEEGKTIVVVTHNKEVAKYAERIIYLKDGKIINEK